MTNNITSGKAPRKRTSHKIFEEGVPLIKQNAQEAQNGDAGRFSQIKAMEPEDMPLATRNKLLRQAGININSKL
jgi:hypothetical protein